MPPLAIDASWSLAPLPLVGLTIAAYAYAARWRTVRRKEGAAAAPTWRFVSFMAGLLVIDAALISPIDTLADQVFAMHMIQHLLLLDAAPILLVLGCTKVVLRPLTRRLQPIEQRAGFLARPAFAVVFYVAVMWLWHVPALYDLALRHSLIHVSEHLCMSLAGGLYWWHLLSPVRTRHFTGFQAVSYMLGTKLLVGLLGIGITFAPHPLYDFYIHHGRVWGLSPGDDQAMSGAIMAIEQSIVMGIALAWLFVRALEESERDEERAERYAA